MNFIIPYNRWFKARKLGVHFLRTKNFILPNFLIFKSEKRFLYFPNNSTYIELFRDIILDDEYKLSLLKDENIINVVDVGANLGMFSIAARIAFKNALIHSYEPNPNNIPVLGKHGKEFSFEIHEEALALKSGRGELAFTSKHDTSARISNRENGITILSDLDTIIERFENKKIDLLKLDCEGSEFEILRDSNALKHIRFISMEYHLPTNGSEEILNDLLSTLCKLKFNVIHHDRRNICLGIIVAKNDA